MIYTSRYGHNILGTPVSISLYPPKDFKGEHLKMLAPEYNTLQSYRKTGDWEKYKAEYRQTIKQRFNQIQEWLQALKPEENITLLCFEDSEQCHRHLVQKLIEKWRPEIWGTRLDDVPKAEFRKSYPEAKQSILQDTPVIFKVKVPVETQVRRAPTTLTEQTILNSYDEKVVNEIWLRTKETCDIQQVLSKIRCAGVGDKEIYSITQDLALGDYKRLLALMTDDEVKNMERVFWS